MIMGFGGMGMAVPWLFGVITVGAIWLGVWWLLTALGMTAQHSHHTTAAAPAPTQLPPAAAWQQPSFTATEVPPPPGQPDPHPTPVRTESDYR